MRQLAKVEKFSSSKAIEYQFSLEVTNAEFSTYFQLYGANISAFQVDFPNDTIYCIKSRCRSAGLNKWIITYYGASTIDDYNFSIVPTKINKSYSLSTFQFTPAMLGVHRATAPEILTTNGGSGTSASSKLDISGDAATPGCWIFNDAIGSSAGSVSWSACPLASTSIGADFINYVLENRLPTTTFTVRFPDSRTTTDQFLYWWGINGSIPSAVAPSDTTTALWMARAAQSETVRNGNSTSQYVIRVMETAPRYFSYQFKWDADKNQTWTW